MSSNEYIQVSVKKETVENVKTVAERAKTSASALKEMIGEKIEETVAVNAVDDAYENNLLVVDQCIVPTEQEIPIRQYNIARLSTPLWKKAYGRLQVTNKRVVFRSTGKSLAGPIMIENEFSLEELGGVEIKSDYRFDLLTFLLSGLGILLLSALYAGVAALFSRWCVKAQAVAPGVILSILTICCTVALFVMMRRKYVFKAAALNACLMSLVVCSLVSGDVGVLVAILIVLVGLAGLGLWIFSGIVDDLHILIKVKAANGTIEIGRKLRTDERSGFGIVRPWTDTEIAIREIGALLDDVKRFGDAGIDKWKV